MDDQQTKDQQDQSVKFLLAEHQYLGNCFWRNEEIGERRVNFFITLVTAAIAALVALATSEKDNFLKEAEVYLITVFALLALLSFGIVTLLRMIHRNMVTDRYKRAMEMIRSHFRRDDRLQNYQPFEKDKPRKLGTGGLVDMVVLVNSVIVAALCALLAYLHLKLGIVLPGWVGFIAALIVQFIYVRHRYDKGRPPKKDPQLTSSERD